MQNISNEMDFENHIRILISETILKTNPNFQILKNKKAVDIIICKEDNDTPSLFFIEIKYHKNNHGRLGIGGGKGVGFQPEILSKRPVYFENNLRWIIGSENSENYFFLNNTELLTFIKDGIIEEKYNNIQKKIFNTAVAHTEEELIEKIKTWLKIK